MNIEYRHVEPLDAGMLHAAAADVFDAVDATKAQIFLRDPRNILIVAVADGIIIGQLQAVLHTHLDAPADLFIDNLGVAPGWRRRGIARRLIALATEAGRRAGADEAWVLTEADNVAAQATYAATGASVREVAMFALGLRPTRSGGEPPGDTRADGGRIAAAGRRPPARRTPE